jgi:hypothetical protein
MTSDARSVQAFAGRPAALEERVLRHKLRLRVTTGTSGSFAVNASRGGVCIERTRVLPVGSRLEGNIWLDGRDLPFVGHVAWSSPGEHRLNQPGRMGVRFDSIAPGFGAGLDQHATRSPFRSVPSTGRNLERNLR